jgi:hypothetical protein
MYDRIRRRVVTSALPCPDWSSCSALLFVVSERRASSDLPLEADVVIAGLDTVIDEACYRAMD